MKRVLLIVAALMSLLTACTPPELTSTVTPLPITPIFFPTDIPTPVPQPIYLNLIWNFHQPLYTRDAQTGLITLPSARVNATRLYHAAGALLHKYSSVHATFSFSPLLLRQLDDISGGARDVYWELSTRQANSLSDEDRQFMLAHFFSDTDEALIRTSPRFTELLTRRGGKDTASVREAAASFTEQELRDLQVWFNLATFSPELLAQPMLSALLRKGRDYTEDDKRAVFDAILGAIRSLDPLYKQLQETGQVELVTSPYAEPIIPLLLDSNIATSSETGNQLPDPPFTYAQDAAEQLKRATDQYQLRRGHPAQGLLLPGGAIAQNIVQPLVTAGIQWTATGQDVLARSLKPDSTNLALTADALNRPYELQAGNGKKLTVVFNNRMLADKVTSYSQVDPKTASDDFVAQIELVKAQLASENATGPHLITVVINGDDTLGAFTDGGQAFLDELYKHLSAAAASYGIQTITPSEYLTRFPNQRQLKSIATGDWGEHGHTELNAWIGSTATGAIWSSLVRARRFLDDYLTGAKPADKNALARAYDSLLLAESSDYLQSNTGVGGTGLMELDRHFRELLGQAYSELGAPPPDYLLVPTQPSVIITGGLETPSLITPTIDGLETDGEWDNANVIRAPETSSKSNGVISAFYYGANGDNLFFRIDARDDWPSLAVSEDSAQPMRVGIYIAKPEITAVSDFTRLGGDGEIRVALGMSATHLLEWTLDSDGASATALYSVIAGRGWAGTPTLFAPGATVGKVLEMATSRKALGGLADLSALNLVIIVTRGRQLLGEYPVNGLAQMTIPSNKQQLVVNENIIGNFDDPVGDDHGPGTYTYPTNLVFQPGSFDLKHVTIAMNGQSLEFKVTLNTAFLNVWNSPIGLSIQTFDIYIDKDPGKTTGARLLLDGRNAVLAPTDGWEYALWIEGWGQQMFTANTSGKINTKSNSRMTVEIDPDGTASVVVPLAELGDGDPTTWGYAIAVLGQEAFPSDGVLRVRDVDPNASEWHFGGAPNDMNHTRIIDYLDTADGNLQLQNSLAQYKSSQITDTAKLTVEDYGTLPVVTIRK